MFSDLSPRDTRCLIKTNLPFLSPDGYGLGQARLGVIDPRKDRSLVVIVRVLGFVGCVDPTPVVLYYGSL